MSQHSSGHTGSSGQSPPSNSLNIPSDVTKLGYLRKLKTMKKKFFTVRSGSRFHPPRVEYYDNEKKFRAGLPPKRTWDLSKCFSVNKRSDNKHKYGIVIYTRDDSFSVLLDSAEELDDWFNEILEAFKEGICDTDQANHHYEYVWPVKVLNDGLGASRGLAGYYRLCLSNEEVSLVKLNTVLPEVTFQLRLIRRCGHNNGQFFMEVGRSSVTGEGDLKMNVEDTAMAQSMHREVLNAMKNPNCFGDRKENLGHSSQPIIVPPGPPEASRIRTTSMGSPSRPPVVAEKPRPKSLFDKSSSLITSRSETLSTSAFGTSPISGIDYTDDVRMRTNSTESRCSRSGANSSLSCDIEETPSDNHSHSQSMARSLTPENGPLPISEYIPMTPGDSAASSVGSSRERLNSNGSSAADQLSPPESYMEMAPGEITTSVSSNKTPPVDTYLDMSPLDSAVSSSAGDSSYAFMGGFNRGGTKSGPSSLKSGPGSHKSGPGSHKSAPSSYTCKSGPSSYKSGPGSHKSGPSSVKSLSSVEGRDDGYIDMEPGSDTLSPVVDTQSPGYFTMSMGPGHNKLGNMGEMRPDKVYSYLSDDSFSGDTPPMRTYSMGSKTSMTKPTLTYQAYQENVAKQSKLANNKSSSAPHLIPTKTRPQVESPTPVSAYVSPTYTPMSKSFKADDADSFMELEFSRPRTASDSFSYRRRAGSFGQTQNHTNPNFQHFRERASSHGHTSKPVMLKRISSESVRTTSQEFLRKASMDSLHKSSRESLKSSQECLRKAVLESRQRGSFQGDYIDMAPDKHKPGSQKKGVHISGKKQSKQEDSKEYLDMTVGSPTQSFIDSGIHTSTPTSPVTVTLTEASSTYMEMIPGLIPDVKVTKHEASPRTVDKLSVSSPSKPPKNPYMNMSYEGSDKLTPEGAPGSNALHHRQASSPAVLESPKKAAPSEGHSTLSPESAYQHHTSPRNFSKPKSPVPRSPLAGEQADSYLCYAPGDLKEEKKMGEAKKPVTSYHAHKKGSKLTPKSPEILIEESDSSYMSFSSDGSLSDSKNSDVWLPRNSHRPRNAHRKSEPVHEEADAGYISFSPVNVKDSDQEDKHKKAQPSGHRKNNSKLDTRKDIAKQKKQVPLKTGKKDEGYMSFAPNVGVSQQQTPVSFPTSVVSSNIKGKTTSSLKEEEGAYLEFSPAGASSDKESSKKNLPSQSTDAKLTKKKHAVDHSQRRVKKVSSGSKPKLAAAEVSESTAASGEYANMSFPATKTETLSTRPVFDPSKAPKSARSAGQPERGVLRSPRATGVSPNKDSSQGGATASGSPVVSDKFRKISCDSMKGALQESQTSGKLPKRGSTPNIPSYSDKPGPCSVVVSNMQPGDRHSYSEPSTSDLNLGTLAPNSGSNSRHASHTSLNSVSAKETLNYASLDLGSSDNFTGDGGITFIASSASPGIVSKSRHSSGQQDPQDAPPFYAQIDFKKCEELKNSKR